MLGTVSVIGGDLRQLTLASAMEIDGYKVKIFGFDRQMDTKALKKAKDIKDAADSDIIILPLPASHDGISLNAPFADSPVNLCELFDEIHMGSEIFGGRVSRAVQETANNRGFKIDDYFTREELSVANAIPTAEGAVEIALSETPFTLHKSRCLVIGYGRIGKILADRLKAFGADVTVSARKYSDFAWIEANGLKPAHTSRLDGIISDFQIIFNTVPSVILHDKLLKKITADTLIIDLASKPGGVDFSLAKELGLKVIWALSLPGKSAPITSGEIIKNTIINILKEKGES